MEFIKDIPIERKTKDKITGAVRSYKILFPIEYETITKSIKTKRWLLDDQEFGESKEDSVIYRALFEIPENLETILLKALSQEEFEQFRGLRGSRWFAKTFPQFRTPEEI